VARVLLTPTIRILTAGTAPTSFPLGADVDMRPLLHGLPDDRCPCPHWGYVLRGRLVFTVADYQETFEAGDGFYVPPGPVVGVAEPQPLMWLAQRAAR
jgi:hypothetical protein